MGAQMADAAAGQRENVWLAIGVHKLWRVTSARRTYGEFGSEWDARRFLELLLIGNPETLCGLPC